MRCRIKELTIGKDLKLKSLAANVSITPQYLSQICNDKAVPHVGVLRKIAKELDCHIDDLYKWDDELN